MVLDTKTIFLGLVNKVYLQSFNGSVVRDDTIEQFNEIKSPLSNNFLYVFAMIIEFH